MNEHCITDILAFVLFAEPDIGKERELLWMELLWNFNPELHLNVLISCIHHHHHHAVPLTVVSGGEVSAALTHSSLRVAVLTVAITLAAAAMRETPKPRQAVGTLASWGPWDTLTLASCLMAEGADGALTVTVASCCWRKLRYVHNLY